MKLTTFGSNNQSWYSSPLFKVISLLTIGIAVSGCATNKPVEQNATENDSEATTSQIESAMIDDLVSYMPDILDSFSSTIQYNDVHSGDSQEAVSGLIKLGYGVQRVSDDQGMNFLHVEQLDGKSNAYAGTVRVKLSVGAIDLVRSYRRINKSMEINEPDELVWDGDSGIVPSSPLEVTGTRVPISKISKEAVPRSKSTTIYLADGSVNYNAESAFDDDIPTITLITRDLVNAITTANLAPVNPVTTASIRTNSFSTVTHVTENAFLAVADSYERVGRETVIFPNDSVILGRNGKLQVEKLLEGYQSSSDLIGLVGCSNGPTSLEIGNHGLALARSKRIAEEFYTAGLSQDKVFNEGCWSVDTDQGDFPNRGVVIDLWRRKV